jgi:hypothetical protein
MKNLRIFFLIGLLFLVALACDISGSSSKQTPGANQGKKVLFQDDFANTDSGWNRVRDPNGNITDYENDGYHILNNQPISHVWANPGLKFNDVRVDVDINKTSGPDDNYFGVICRYKDGSNFYILAISSDGYYGIVKVLEGSLSLLGSDQMQPSEAIQQGNAANHLSAECKGDSLSLSVNGHALLSVEDDAFSSGDVGLEVTTRQSGGVDVLFTHFSVTKP